MGRLGLAFRLFFRILFNGAYAEEVRRRLEGPAPAPAAPPKPVPATQKRSEALTLLSVLQREGRLIDFLKENLSGYADAQIGAAVRDVHRDCAAALDRLFAPRPVRNEPEGQAIDIPRGFDAARIRLTGNIAGEGPFRGALRHGGWEATRVELPEWSGPPSAANVVAPAEIEVS